MTHDRPYRVPPSLRRAARWLLPALLLGLLAGPALAGAVHRIQTDHGELVITTESPDVEVIVRQNGKVIRIIDTRTNKEVKLEAGLYELETKDQGDGLKLSLDKVTIRRGDVVLATVERTGKAVAVKPPVEEKTGEVRRHAWEGAHLYVSGFSPDGRFYYAAGENGERSTIRVWDVAAGKEQELSGHEGWITGAVFSPDGKYLLSCAHLDRAARLWDLTTFKQVQLFDSHADVVTSVAFSPDGRRALTGSVDKVLRLWDVTKGKELRKLEGHTEACSGAFSPDGKVVLSFGGDATLRLWDAETGKVLHVLKGHTEATSGVFSSDGKRVLSGSGDKTLRLWDAATGKELAVLTGHTEAPWGFRFLPGDAQGVSYSGGDKTLRIWDLATGKEVRQHALGDDFHKDLAVSPEGRRFLTGHEDRTVRLRDLKTGEELHRFEMADINVPRGLSFGPDGRLVAAGSHRGWVYLYRLPARDKTAP
jgi:WD40 repeat protein